VSERDFLLLQRNIRMQQSVLFSKLTKISSYEFLPLSRNLLTNINSQKNRKTCMAD